MCIHGYGRLAECHGLHHVGRLAPHAGQAGELFHLLGHLAIEVVHQHAGQFHQMFGLGVGIRHTFDQFINLRLFGLCHGLGVGILGKQLWSNHVHPLVGALCAEHHGNQQLEHAAVFQLCGHLWHFLLKMFKDVLISILLPHSFPLLRLRVLQSR